MPLIRVKFSFQGSTLKKSRRGGRKLILQGRNMRDLPLALATFHARKMNTLCLMGPLILPSCLGSLNTVAICLMASTWPILQEPQTIFMTSYFSYGAMNYTSHRSSIQIGSGSKHHAKNLMISGAPSGNTQHYERAGLCRLDGGE